MAISTATRRRARPFPRHLATRARAGSVYVAVLGVAMIISLVAMASMHLARNETDVVTGAEQIAHAELLAQSAVEFGIARLHFYPDWRTDFNSGDTYPSSGYINLGSGGIKVVLVDADGNLNDDHRDIVTVRGIGRVGEATQAASVQLEPAANPRTCLAVGMHAGGNLTVTGTTTVTTDRTVSSNGNISVTGGLIEGSAYAVGTITGTVTGTKTSSAAARGMPSDAEMWTYYLANGTYISIASIPSQTIDNVVLSAANNPYGAENPQGIYIIDTEGQPLRIRDSRIEATLVVISPAVTTEVTGYINWAPPGPNFPALLVDGNLTMNWSGGSSLDEAAEGVNFNPAGTPYETVADADQTDSYPGVIKGLVYCDGTLSVTNPCVMQGVLVSSGAASVSSTLTIAYSGVPAAFPPPGFASGSTMRVIPRTWKRSSP